MLLYVCEKGFERLKPYYSTDWGNLYHGNCLDILPYLEPVDLMLTDPPYGLNKKIHDGGTWSTKEKYDAVLNWDVKLFNKDILKLLRYSKNQIIWGGNYYKLPVSRCWLCWVKPHFPTMSEIDLAWTSFDMPSKYYACPRVNNSPHPTPKPVGLFMWILEKYSEPTDTIMDCFAGSGTTGIACERLNRKYILIEQEEKYCEIIAKRIELERKQLKMF